MDTGSPKSSYDWTLKMIFFYTTIALHLAKEIYYESWKVFFFSAGEEKYKIY